VIESDPDGLRSLILAKGATLVAPFCFSVVRNDAARAPVTRDHGALLVAVSQFLTTGPFRRNAHFLNTTCRFPANLGIKWRLLFKISHTPLYRLQNCFILLSGRTDQWAVQQHEKIAHQVIRD